MKVYTKEEMSINELSLTYDDISLIPTEVSRIRSRMEPSTETKFLGNKLKVPVVSSPMDTVTGLAMAKELNRLGCMGVLNRFDSSLKELLETDGKLDGITAVSISLHSDEELIERLAAKNLVLCIDTANANNEAVLDKCEEIKKNYDVKVMIGNIAHGSTLKQLVDAGADAVRIGIGGGSVCTTSVQTGIGIGQVSSLLNVYYAREKDNLKIELIADGGIKSPGDVAKAIAVGADIVMLGRMLAGTKETPGEVIKYNDQLWKKYRGSASFGVKMKNEFIEGEETMIPYKGNVANVINAISDGLRSAMSYMNCFTLEELRTKDAFAILSNSSYLERLPKK
ncbi:MAG: guanosine monophosphate reductase [Melioribacteraceae bacterium]|nr:guanosine monophosphate reductase [Melioribacteraceae bacterium]MCF8355814.1 guanosine monophosphate reductase [Melioribacteraceae bacterium]MCF8395304.1 guanosine monophosphate reductase [Melioribacteraceae bacterium]MCF8420752.1 guanosine monophosphate reductase [Melioribacteraceae bacterium]